MAALMRVEGLCEEPRAAKDRDWRVAVFAFVGGRFQVEVTPEQFNEVKAYVGQQVTVDVELTHQSVAKGNYVNDFFRPSRLVRVVSSKAKV